MAVKRLQDPNKVKKLSKSEKKAKQEKKGRRSKKIRKCCSDEKVQGL